MRAVIQRVKNESVTVDGAVVGAIEKGILVLLGVEAGDTAVDLEWLVARLARVRIFEDENGKMNLSLRDVGGDALVVSQFTLFGSMKKRFTSVV